MQSSPRQKRFELLLDVAEAFTESCKMAVILPLGFVHY
jgi:hypothetical protein